MMESNLTLPFSAELPQFFAKMREHKRENFVKLVNTWDSARELADDLYDIGYVKASERTIINWRNRTYKHVSYEAVLAVKLAHERRLLDRDIKDAKIQEIISDL